MKLFNFDEDENIIENNDDEIKFENALKLFNQGILDIKKISDKDLNEYDFRLANNGGGYNQYEYIYLVNNCPLIYEDTSCGDFGIRCSTTFGPYVYWFNTVDNNNEIDFSSFPKSKEVVEFLNAIKRELPFVHFYTSF